MSHALVANGGETPRENNEREEFHKRKRPRKAAGTQRDESKKRSGRKASKEKLTSKTNADKRIEAVEKKASRLGVAKHRKGHVLGRE